jgi:hypothetical protein
MNELRYAQIRGARTSEEVRAYLPENYSVFRTGPDDGRLLVTIRGVDRAGWTLDDYVLPRLASGSMYGNEIPAPADAAKEAV